MGMYLYLEEIVGEEINPNNTSFYICGWQETVQTILDLLMARGFVTKDNMRKDGSYDIKFESCGEIYTGSKQYSE